MTDVQRQLQLVEMQIWKTQQELGAIGRYEGRQSYAFEDARATLLRAHDAIGYIRKSLRGAA
jgi:hypothetical protein